MLQSLQFWKQYFTYLFPKETWGMLLNLSYDFMDPFWKILSSNWLFHVKTVCFCWFCIFLIAWVIIEVTVGFANTLIWLCFLIVRDRDHGARDAYYSPRRSRPVSRSASPKEERTYKSHNRSPRHRSISRSLSPHNEKHVKLRLQHSPGENGKRVHDEDYVRAHDEGYLRSNAPGRKSESPSRPRSRSYRWVCFLFSKLRGPRFLAVKILVGFFILDIEP